MATSQLHDDRRARYEALVESVVEPMRRYATRRADEASAQDAVSDALLVLWRRLDDVPVGGELPWAYAVTRHCLANVERASRRHRGLTLRIARLDPPAEVSLEPESADQELHEALRRLPADDRELLRLWAWEELRPAEIAVVLGVTANAVSIRLTRAKGRLAAELAAAPTDPTATGETASGELARPRKDRAGAGHIRVDGGEGQAEGRSR